QGGRAGSALAGAAGAGPLAAAWRAPPAPRPPGGPLYPAPVRLTERAAIALDSGACERSSSSPTGPPARHRARATLDSHEAVGTMRATTNAPPGSLGSG